MHPHHVTTDLAADLRASLLKMDLEEHAIAAHTEAEKLALLAVNVTDRALLDAALWKAAEGLYALTSPAHSDREPLRDRPVLERQRYLLQATQAWNWLRLTLEGTFPVDVVAQAVADQETHVAEIARRRHLRAVSR